MPPPLAVDKEQVRMLVLSVGVREAARQCGIAQGTVQDWSAKGKWLEPTRAKPAALPPPASMVNPTNPTNPADALANTLREDALATRVGLTKYTKRMAERAARGGQIEEAPLYKAVAEIHGKMHPEQQQSSQTVINIALLGRELPCVELIEPVAEQA